jgi:hypothetical protein
MSSDKVLSTPSARRDSSLAGPAYARSEQSDSACRVTRRRGLTHVTSGRIAGSLCRPGAIARLRPPSDPAVRLEAPRSPPTRPGQSLLGEVIRRSVGARGDVWGAKTLLRRAARLTFADQAGLTDKKPKKIEECLNSFVRALVRAADALDRKQREAEERRRQWKEWEGQREREEQARRELAERVERLDKQLKAWQMARDIRKFVGEARALFAEGGGAPIQETGCQRTRDPGRSSWRRRKVL